MRYQIVDGIYLPTTGNWVLESYLLREAGVIKALWRPVDFALDLLVLQLFSMATIDKLVSYYTWNSDEVSYHGITAIIMTLYFCWLHLYPVNTDHVDA